MPNIFQYADYRKFLADYYQEKKTKSPAFSYNNLSVKAGLKSKGYLHDVLHGVKNLSKPTIVKLSQALGLKKDEALYFENLVFFNQAVEAKEKSYFLEQLQAVRPKDPEGRQAQELRQDQYAFYSQWYHSAIRSLLDLFPFNDDYKFLAKKVYPAIHPNQAKRSVELLQKLGLVKRQPDGALKLSDKSITTGQEVVNTALVKFHLEAMQLAARALQELPAKKRNISGLTLGISEKSYEKICQEIYQTQEKIMRIATEDKEADRVYRLNFHFFPMSQPNREEKNP